MIDDVTETPAQGPINLEKVKDLWKFRVHRAQSERWALRDIRFLVYDDTNVQEHGYDSDDEEATLQRALQMSTESDIEGSPTANSDTPQAPLEANVESKSVGTEERDEDEDLQRAIAMSLGQDIEGLSSGSNPRKRARRAYHPCGICGPLPEFPHAFQPRKFRLYQPTEQQFKSTHPCIHYVAVSYCWPEPVRDEDGNIIKTEGSYQVRELDGRVRKSRALDDIIDRAVDFANSCGLRMIWIDQECLPQPTEDSPQEEKDYQQIGVQSMDILYNRALVTAGLHAVEMTSQGQLDAVQELIALSKGKAPKRLFYDPPFINHVVRFLDMVCNDRWYTRAWVVQEAMSAGSSLFLVYRRGNANPGVNRVRFGDGGTTPKHSLDTADPTVCSSQVLIQVDDFRHLIRTSQSVFGPYMYLQAIGRFPINGQYPDVRAVLSAAASLHPTVARTNQMVHMYGPSVYGSRQRLDGASALTLLKTRKCLYPEDRIAVLANMCGYEVRLNTTKVAKHCGSLRVGLLAVMLLNGDLSALAPEAYRNPSSELREASTKTGLLSPFDLDAGKASYCSINQGNLVVPRAYSHSTHLTTGLPGLPFHAYLWLVEGELDLTPIKLQWAEEWNQLQDEPDNAYEQRKRLTAEHFVKEDIMELAQTELFHHGTSNTIPADSLLWTTLPVGVTRDGIKLTLELEANMIKLLPEARRTLSQIILQILQYLHTLSASDPRAAGAVNSIWHSIRTDSLSKNAAGTYRDDLPDAVGPALFEHPSLLKAGGDILSLLQLDREDDGAIDHSMSDGDAASKRRQMGSRGYRQLWFIDRVMTTGRLWVGRYVPAPRGAVWLPPRDDPTMSEYMMPEEKGSTILSRQLNLQIYNTMSAMVVGIGDNEDAKPQRPNDSSVTASTLTYFAYLVTSGVWTPEADDKRARELVAVFDVNGPCTVATPFVPDWEMLPRPGIRGMSVCWVVERDVVAGEEAQEGKGKEKEKGGSGGSGGDAGEDVEEEGRRGGSKVRKEMFMDDQGKLLVYRVVNKVKGLWEVIELTPQQQFLFT